jgi:hypothetical protein
MQVIGNCHRAQGFEVSGFAAVTITRDALTVRLIETTPTGNRLLRAYVKPNPRPVIRNSHMSVDKLLASCPHPKHATVNDVSTSRGALERAALWDMFNGRAHCLICPRPVPSAASGCRQACADAYDAHDRGVARCAVDLCPRDCARPHRDHHQRRALRQAPPRPPRARAKKYAHAYRSDHVTAASSTCSAKTKGL